MKNVAKTYLVFLLSDEICSPPYCLFFSKPQTKSYEITVISIHSAAKLNFIWLSVCLRNVWLPNISSKWHQMTLWNVTFIDIIGTLYEPRHDKTNKVTVCPAKTQIILGIRPVWSESLLSAWRKLGSLATHWAHSKDSDQIRPVWSESSLGAHSFCWFCHEVAHITLRQIKSKCKPFSHLACAFYRLNKNHIYAIPLCSSYYVSLHYK